MNSLKNVDQTLNDIDQVLQEHHFTDAMNGVFQALEAENARSRRWATGEVDPLESSERSGRRDTVSSIGENIWCYWTGRAWNVLHNVHSSTACYDTDACALHKPSDHHMRTWPMNWRLDRRIFERLCPHNIGHPDPDSIAAMISDDGIHGCDGCCRTPDAHD